MNDLFINDLSFRYPNGKVVLDGLNMQVKRGSIYGFIGANGAGKSTTIRLILGLLSDAENRIELFGKKANLLKSDFINSIGFLIEKPIFYSHLTCEENLKLLCIYYNIDPKNIQPSLDRVGLLASGKTIYKRCSTGMKQRLAIAKAILHRPKFLILDEPFNGMDPEWIAQIRICLKELNEEGVTIFYSSHLLSEMEKLVTDIGILKDGKIIIEKSIKDILTSSTDKIMVHIQLKGEINLEGFEFDSNGIELASGSNGNFLFALSDRTYLNKLISMLVNNGFIITDIEVKKPTLESFFLNYIA